MSLGNKQREFTLAIAELIIYAYEELEVELTVGDAFRDPRVFGKFGERKGYGTAKSNHKNRLAMDLNLFVDGEWIQSSEHPMWRKLHQYWVKLGGATLIEDDMNHFSFWWNGYR